MNYNLFQLYAASKKMVDTVESHPEFDFKSEALSEFVSGIKSANDVIELTRPDYLRRYTMEQEMFKSFTPEQRDFICSQIGHWYLMWENKMWIEDKPNQHWLGRGKEELKTMLCGDS